MIVPFIVFYGRAAADEPQWFHVYWLWEKSKDVLLAYTLYKLCYRHIKQIPLFVLIFTIIRLIWHIITVTLGISVNHPMFINILFVILVTACVFLMTRQLIKKWPRAEK